MFAGDGGDGEDAVAVGAGGFEARADGVGEVVFGGQKKHGAWSRERGVGGLRISDFGLRIWGAVVVSLCETGVISRSEMATMGRPGTAGGDSGGDFEGEEAFAGAG